MSSRAPEPGSGAALTPRFTPFADSRLPASGQHDGFALFVPLYQPHSKTLRGWDKFDISPVAGNRMFYGSLEYRYAGVGMFANYGMYTDNQPNGDCGLRDNAPGCVDVCGAPRPVYTTWAALPSVA